MISIIAGTNRSKSNTLKVARTCHELLEGLHCKSQILSLEALPKDFFFAELYGEQSESFQQLVEKYIHSTDQIVFVIPEYHGSFPGVLKAFMDALNGEDVENKKAFLVGVASGHAGGLRPLGQFTEVLHHLKMEVYSRKPKLSGIDKLVDEDRITENAALDTLKTALEGYLKF